MLLNVVVLIRHAFYASDVVTHVKECLSLRGELQQQVSVRQLIPKQLFNGLFFILYLIINTVNATAGLGLNSRLYINDGLSRCH